MNLGLTVNSSYDEGCPSISADGLSLFFHSKRPGGFGNGDLWVTTRATIYDPWGAPQNLGATVNSAYSDWAPSISADGLALFFGSNRPDAFGGYSMDLWVTTRTKTYEDWGTPVNLGQAVNSLADDAMPNISADGFTLYFGANRSVGFGSWDLWQVPVFYGPVCGDDEHPYPIGDLNHDCRVDFCDLAVLFEHWLEDNNPNPYDYYIDKDEGWWFE